MTPTDPQETYAIEASDPMLGALVIIICVLLAMGGICGVVWLIYEIGKHVLGVWP